MEVRYIKHLHVKAKAVVGIWPKRSETITAAMWLKQFIVAHDHKQDYNDSFPEAKILQIQCKGERGKLGRRVSWDGACSGNLGIGRDK